MPDRNPDVTLATLHGDLAAGFAEMRAGFADLKGEMRAGFTDLKATLVTGFSALASRESAEEMVRLLREGNRLHEERFTQLDLRGREQHLATQHVLHSLAESHQRLTQSHERLAEEHRLLSAEQRGLSRNITALIARLDAIIRGRNNGEPTA